LRAGARHAGPEPRLPIAAQMRHQHAMASTRC
jgi:hypothetical protein